jgi:putative flavoprotein involved in K+ transport
VDVAVIGAGHAGLSVSKVLSGFGIEHVVLEGDRIGQGWRDRWDSFCLVTPNWAIDLPDATYEGDDPDGFMPKEDIVTFLEAYAARAGLPVREGLHVDAVSRDEQAFTLSTSDGELRAKVVVICTGAFQSPHVPEGAASLPADLFRVDPSSYGSPDRLPPGGVLVVGSGQTGCQMAEELHESGRRVVLSCGRAPWIPRRSGGRDIVWWLAQSGFLEQPVGALPDPREKLVSNPLTTGHGGGHDLHYRTLQRMGVELAGRFVGADDREIRFEPDLAVSVAGGDERYLRLRGLFDQVAQRTGIEHDLEDPEPFDASGAPETLSLGDISSVVFAGGFRPDYSWLPWPGAFDDMGFPVQVDGRSGVVDGLFFSGVHFLRKRKSAILLGGREDAEVVGAGVAAYLGAGTGSRG